MMNVSTSLAGTLPASHVGPEVRLSTLRMTSLCCASLVVLTIVSSRFGLPLGAKQIPLTLPVAVAHIGAILLLTGGRLVAARLLATLGMLAVVCFETALVHRHTSMLSLLYVIAIYVPLVAGTDVDDAGLRRIWRAFIYLAVVVAVLGGLQIFVQLAAGGYYLDPVQLLPERIRLMGYSTTYPIMKGVLPTLKANGMLFVEPSAFSQFLALAVLGELWLFRRWSVLAILGGGLVVAFSGTGLLMLGAGIAMGARPRMILSLGAAGAVALAVLVASGYGEAFTSRVDEVRRPGTSGYERFVAPFLAMSEPWQDSVDAVVWGYGAGRVEDLDTEYAANYSPVPKVFLEYGLVGFVAFTLLWLTMFRRLMVPRTIRGAQLVMYFLAAGSLLQPYTVFALWGLTAGFRRAPREPDAPGEWSVSPTE
jgi:hypothetical protein